MYDKPLTIEQNLTLLDRPFSAERMNQVWLGDIIYVAPAEGWLYLAVVLDRYSRKIVGWSMQPTLARQFGPGCPADGARPPPAATGLAPPRRPQQLGYQCR